MSDSARIAAAVCYRRGANGIEFLLVRTKGGGKWTFPKGHVEESETARAAAAREAREEAGAVGAPTRAALARYLYASGSSDREVHPVTAYLLAVRALRAPDEPRREPTWFAPRAALRALARGGREARFVTEHQRVLDSALHRLARKQARPASRIAPRSKERRHLSGGSRRPRARGPSS